MDRGEERVWNLKLLHDDGDDGADLRTSRRAKQDARKEEDTQTHPKLCAAQLGELHLYEKRSVTLTV